MNKTKIMFFSASTCGPCCLVKSQMSDDIVKELNIEIIDEKDKSTFAMYHIENVPAFIKVSLDNNEELNRQFGYKSIKELRRL